jgi:dynein heavy chain
MRKIHFNNLKKENQNLLQVTDENCYDWMNYTLCIDSMVLQSLHKALTCSLTYLLNETDTKRPHLESLFEVQLELDDLDEFNCEIVFRPSLHHGEGLLTLVSELIQNIFAQGSLIPRVAAHLKKENYQVSLTIKF